MSTTLIAVLVPTVILVTAVVATLIAQRKQRQ